MVVKDGNQGPMLIPANQAEIIFLSIRKRPWKAANEESPWMFSILITKDEYVITILQRKKKLNCRNEP